MAPSKATTIDFSNVKEGGNFNRNRIPAGDYLAQIVKVEDAPSKKDDVMQYLYSIKITKHASRIFPYYCKLQENQLWKLRNIMIAAGINVPKKKMKVDPNRIVGKTIGVTIEDAEYDGKEQSEIAAIFPAAELQDGNLVDDGEDVDTDTDEGDEEDYATDADVEEDEVEEEEEAEDTDNLDELDRAELKKMIQVINGADWKAKKSQSDDDLREIIRAAAAPEEEAEEDEEEEEEEPAPVVKKKAKAKATTKKKAAAVTDDELEELDIDDI